MSHAVRFALLALVGALAAACGDNLGAAPGDGDGDGGTQGTDAGVRTPDAGGGELGCPSDIEPGRLEQGAWDTRFTVAGFTGHDGLAPIVYDTARDVDGSLVATGNFQWLGSERVEPLLRLTDSGWQPARETWELPLPPAGFASVAIDAEGGLALASYDDFGERVGQIWLDDGSGLRVIGAFDGAVRSIEWYRGQLWAAGVFQMTAGSETIQSLAVWDGAAWSAPPGGPADSFVFELTLDGDRLLAGGAFDGIGGITARRIAAFDGATGAWSAIDLDFDPANAVYALARDAGGALYAGGSFGDIAGGHGSIARLDGDTWTLVGGGVAQYALGGVVTDLLALDGSIYVTGCFNSAGGPDGEPDTTPAWSLARWDGDAWRSLDDGSRRVLGSWFRPAVCGDEGPLAVWDAEHQTLAADGERVLVGGSFPGAAGVLSQSVIIGGGTEADPWSPQGPVGLGLGGWPERVAAGGPDCALHALGDLSHAGGQPVSSHLIRFDGDHWTEEGEAMPADLYCPALAVDAEGDALVGCIGPPPDQGSGGGGVVLRARDGAWERIAAADTLGPVYAMKAGPDGRVWIAGGSATGDSGYVARLDGDEVEVIEDGFDLPVFLVDPGADDVLVTGDFTRVGDLAASRIARWDGSGWSALGDGLPSAVTAVAHDANRVYVSTLDAGGGGGFLLGSFDGEAWTELASAETGLTPVPSFSFNAMRPVGGVLVVVGTAELDEGGQRGALVWDGERFRGLAGGVHAIFVADLALTRDGLWFAGGIAEAGEGDGLTATVGVARLALPSAP